MNARNSLPVLLLMTGCMLGPDFERPEPPPVAAYVSGDAPAATVAANGVAQHFEMGGELAGDWWRLFKSAKLDAVVKDAIAKNLSLQVAQANLRQSQATLQAGYGIFYPQVDVGFSPSRQKFSSARFGGTSPGSIFNLFTLSSTVSYTLDVFGGERRSVESLEAQKDLQRYTAIATYLSLTGNIVNTIIARAAYLAEVDATQQLIELLRKQISVTEAQVKSGTAPYLNILSLRSQLATLEATLPSLK